LLPQVLSDGPIPIDHIIAQQHEGRTTFANLALSCLHDNCSTRAGTAGSAIFAGILPL
jgi:hypothetical protein